MSKRVLLIDDEPALNTALLIRLRASGYDVATASSGPAGLQMARSLHPDVIILDIRMPDMDGYEVCRRLKLDSELASIPVIFMSANVQESARTTALEVGGLDFLSKPFEAPEVLAAIEAAISAASAKNT